jgi:hypothetical protein
MTASGFNRTIWAASLLAGTFTHARTLLQHGLGWHYGGGWPLATRVFWTSLTGFDPLAAALLFFKPRWGVVITVAIMLADVAHNSWAFTRGRGDMVALVLQATFLGYVLGTSPNVWAATGWGGGRKG